MHVKINNLPAWKALETLAERRPRVFSNNGLNQSQLIFQANSLTLDISRQNLDQEVLTTLLKLADQSQLATSLNKLFSGEEVNFTEQRAATHISSRGTKQTQCHDALFKAESLLDSMETFAQKFHDKKIYGFSGKPLKNIVHIGIGGSDLGPRLLVQSLMAGHRTKVPIYFVSSIDLDDLAEALLDLNPEETLFIISSKSFTTAETLSNAYYARMWLANAASSLYEQQQNRTMVPEEESCFDKSAVLIQNSSNVNANFTAVTNNINAALHFGINQNNIFEIPLTVGGRFSIWSAVGLPVMLAAGVNTFRQFLKGGQLMDQHCINTPFPNNLPVLMALISLWNNQFLDIESLAVLPYAHALRGLPAYLQQLEMESNGKAVTSSGKIVNWNTSQIVWGGSEPNGQHAFHQLLYQGTRCCSLDFIVLNPYSKQKEIQLSKHLMLSYAIAQACALMIGRTKDEAISLLKKIGKTEEEIAILVEHYVINSTKQPSNTLKIENFCPMALGELIALYEYKTIILGFLWDINSFDQFGVELGKQMVQSLENKRLDHNDI